MSHLFHFKLRFSWCPFHFSPFRSLLSPHSCGDLGPLGPFEHSRPHNGVLLGFSPGQAGTLLPLPPFYCFLLVFFNVYLLCPQFPLQVHIVNSYLSLPSFFSLIAPYSNFSQVCFPASWAFVPSLSCSPAPRRLFLWIVPSVLSFLQHDFFFSSSGEYSPTYFISFMSHTTPDTWCLALHAPL